MTHLGDITQIRGDRVPTVDVIIGGSPCLWKGINGKGTCLWASEIEEFPMAVTKLRIGE